MDEKITIIGEITPTESWWVTWDDGKAQVRRAIAEAGLKPTFFVTRAAADGRFIMPIATGGTVEADRKVGSPIIYKAG